MTTKLFLNIFKIAAAKFSGSRRILSTGTLLTALIGGCAVQEAPTLPVVVVPEVITPKPVALTDAANAALKTAEQSVIEARVKRALWIAAVEELKRARSAAQTFDSDSTLRHAREVIALCDLSIAQLARPPVTW